MSLSCSCEFDDWEGDPGQWLYWPILVIDFESFSEFRRKRCCSCHELIEFGAPCLKHPRSRYPYNDIESKIKVGVQLEDALADEPWIRIGSHFQCERCGEIWLNLRAIGYECLSPGENMQDALQKYHDLAGFNNLANNEY